MLGSVNLEEDPDHLEWTEAGLITLIPLGAWFASLYGRVKREIRLGTCYWYTTDELFDEKRQEFLLKDLSYWHVHFCISFLLYFFSYQSGRPKCEELKWAQPTLITLLLWSPEWRFLYCWLTLDTVNWIYTPGPSRNPSELELYHTLLLVFLHVVAVSRSGFEINWNGTIFQEEYGRYS
ncbi:hypothetical protein L5515_006696 [Caenorhabditis briggsae]|uniref:Uncharacterized protein n=1 Tax=Caenorhabditis briggsae TaxID=6238 RepID=A0AAE9EWK6_CAEBR|nr:hypothetical protein L5515_006696 [Caenorhabditis briggsae]